MSLGKDRMTMARFGRVCSRLLAGASVALAALVAVALPAQADETWTWSTATHPAGAASVGPLGWGTAGGGVYRYHGMHFVPGVGHMDQPLGSWRDESVTGTGTIGKVLYTTYPGSSSAVDMGLIGTGTKPQAAKVRVSNGWQDANVMDVAHPGEITTGLTLCHSGTSPETIAADGYRCGRVTADCAVSSTQCSFDALASGGDSGGPVWWYRSGGITLYGWINGRAGFGDTVLARFTPVWALQDHDWTAAQTEVGWPVGNDGTGCFVTYDGCVRS